MPNSNREYYDDQSRGNYQGERLRQDRAGQDRPGQGRNRQGSARQQGVQKRSGGGNHSGGPAKKKKGKLVLFIFFILLWLGAAAGIGYFVWRSGDKEIKQVTTYPTKDVGLITGAEALQDPVYRSIWSGIESAQQKNGMTTGYVSAKANIDKEINNAIDEACKDYRIVVCCGQDWADNVLEKAQTYTQIKFVFIEGNIYKNEGEESTLPNVLEVGFRAEETSYLAGYLAAKSFNGTFGFIGAKDTAYYGFALGVNAVDSYRQVLHGLPGGAQKTNRIKDLTSSLYNNDSAEVIYHSVGYKDEQVILETARSTGKKVIASGAAEVQGNEVFGTVVKRYDTVAEDLLGNHSQLKMGQRVTLGFKENALDLTKPQSDVSDTLWKQIEDMKDKIRNGQLKTPGTKEEYDVKVML